jgi:hypothetical protein
LTPAPKSAANKNTGQHPPFVILSEAKDLASISMRIASLSQDKVRGPPRVIKRRV